MNQIDVALIDWSRAQFALTAMYHWLFVPLTLGLGLIICILETMYFKTGDEKWKKTTKFWMKLFGVNFAIGVATGLILEFEFGTNWSNYSWFVGDIFGAPLAIEGVVAFFLEATFIGVMFFGWEKVSKKFHLTSTWLAVGGATISAWWILVANSWMQYPAGMTFNPDTVRNEMNSFVAVALSPVAVNKFFHTVISSWVLGSTFVIGISSWFLLKKRDKEFALDSIRIAAIVGVVAILLTWVTGHQSAQQVADKQPMKLAAMEALYDGGNGIGMKIIGNIAVPKMLSFLIDFDANSYVPGINDIKQGYSTPKGKVPSIEEKIQKGKVAITALGRYTEAKKAQDAVAMKENRQLLDENIAYFGYGYFKSASDAIPNVSLVFYSFRIMVALGSFFLLLFVVVWYYTYKKKFAEISWLQKLCLYTIPLAYICGQAGWLVVEFGRQPWAIQDLLPVSAAVSDVSSASVITTFFIFLALFTTLLIAGIGIMVKQIKGGPEKSE